MSKRTFQDWRGEAIEVPGVPERVVSLVPSVTDTLFTLGLGDRVVGVTRYCVHPSEEVRTRAQIGGTKNPDVEAIAALEPDLVLMNAEENRPIDVERLEERGLRVHVSMPRTVDETIEGIADVGAMFDVPTEANAMIDDILTARDEAEAKASPRIAYLIWWKPIMTLNADTYIHDVLACAGAINAFAEHETRYPKIDADAIRDAAVDQVLLSSEPYEFGETERRELAESTGLPLDRIRFVDGELASWHGARTARGIRHVAAVLARG